MKNTNYVKDIEHMNTSRHVNNYKICTLFNRELQWGDFRTVSFNRTSWF